MDAKNIAAVAAQGNAAWEQLKPRWYELKLPGSQYSPDEFIACLLLAQVGGDANTIARRVAEAHDILEALRRDSSVSNIFFSSASTNAALLMALLNSATAEGMASTGRTSNEPVKPEEPLAGRSDRFEGVTTCPHCSHEFAKCVAGGYALSGEEQVQPIPQVADKQSCCHVGTDGKCVNCTNENTVGCSDCDETIIKAKGRECKYPGCDHIYCDECAGNNLSETGFCNDCSTVECNESECRESFDRGTGKKCSNSDCPNKDEEYCDECAPDIFNEQGLCPKCSGEGEYECDNCQHSVTASKAVKCKADCERVYCKKCAGDNLNESGYCDDCKTVKCSECHEEVDRDNAKKCSNPECQHGVMLCDMCAARLLNERGECAGCSDEETSDCSDCGNTTLDPRLTKCRNFDSCGNAYCGECDDNLKDGMCPECRPKEPKKWW